MITGNIKTFLFVLCDTLFFLLFAGAIIVFPLQLAGGNNQGRVYIKKEGVSFQLVKNGKPFIIRGACGGSNMRELADMGANTLRVYDTVNLSQILDDAETNGLSVIVDIPILPYHQQSGFQYGRFDYYGNPDKNRSTKEMITRLIRRHKSHPALLFWNLGNEVYYPPLVLRQGQFIQTFNDLIDLIHKEDPEHLVATTFTFPSKKSLANIMMHSNKLDLIGFNVFGGVNNFQKELSKMAAFSSPFPFYISEWGHHGPWESGFTKWGAPTEQSNSKKVEQIQDHYKILKPYEAGASLGSLYFYWGEKLEGTHTWFSSHLGDSLTSEVAFTVKQLWTEGQRTESPIGLDYMLLDEQDTHSDLLFSPGEEKKARLIFSPRHKDSLEVRWELMPEPWDMREWGIRTRPPIIPDKVVEVSLNTAILTVPEQEGPYRLFVYVIDREGNYATSNIPFYVINNKRVN